MFELYRDDSELAPKLGLEFSLCNPSEILEDFSFWLLNSTDGKDLMCCGLMLLQHWLLGHYVLLLGQINVLLLFNISWLVIWSWLLCWINGDIRWPCLYIWRFFWLRNLFEYWRRSPVLGALIWPVSPARDAVKLPRGGRLRTTPHNPRRRFVAEYLPFAALQ